MVHHYILLMIGVRNVRNHSWTGDTDRC